MGRDRGGGAAARRRGDLGPGYVNGIEAHAMIWTATLD